MVVLDILFIAIIVYLFVYCIYRLFFYIKAKDIENFFEINEKTRNFLFEKNKLCVIIYATQKEKNLDKLLNVLNNQSYSKEHYEVHVVYKRDEDDRTQEREFALGAIIHNIKNPDYFSQDKAINLVVHKILSEKKFDAFVFLGANRSIGEKYLENINKTVLKGSVLTGAKICINESTNFIKRIKKAIVQSYIKYSSATRDIVRTMYDLSNLIDGQNFVVASDVLEKMTYVSTQNKDDLLEYSLDLALHGFKVIYSPYIITAINIKDYDFSSASLKSKIISFTHYFPILAFKHFAFREFILFHLKPNSIVFILLYLTLLLNTISIPNLPEQKAVAFLSVFLLINFIISVKVARMTYADIFWLMFYPFLVGLEKIKIFSQNISRRTMMETRYEEENINSATINAIVNNNRKDIDCKLDLVSEDGMRKVVFREGNRFIETDSYLRMFDAMEDIIYKLQTKGLILKTCQNCAHFSIQPDGTLDCLNGKCMISNSEILIWNGCQYFSLHPDKKEKE